LRRLRGGSRPRPARAGATGHRGRACGGSMELDTLAPMTSAALAVYPLIAEARQRQRRRRALLLFLLGAMIVAVGTAALHDWGATPSGTAVRRQPSIASQVN